MKSVVFLFIVVVSHFFCFSESKYDKCFTLNLIELLEICQCQIYVSFCVVVTVALSFEESERMSIFVASMQCRRQSKLIQGALAESGGAPK